MPLQVQNAPQRAKARQERRGLSADEVAASREKHGENRLSRGRAQSFLRHFFGNLGDPVIRILLCALAINLVFVFRGGDWVESMGIAISVFLATLISTLSERGSEAAFRRLADECDRSNIRTLRDGVWQQIPIEELVVGDRVLLSAGEQVPADGFLCSGHLSVDQSAMTGESREIEKLPRRDTLKNPNSQSAVFRGCPILAGEGEMEIFAVGDSTFLGQISQEIQLRTRESPLKVRLSKLARQISRLGYAAAILIALAYLFNIFVVDSGFHLPLIQMKLRDGAYLIEHLLHALMLGLTVVVVAVPEGLPMMIAVVLSSNIRRMMRDSVLVRTPSGIEAAGSMDLLFTDKTGTLTEGKMSIGQILLADAYEFDSYAAFQKSAPRTAERYALSCVINTASSIGRDGVMGGNATDRALLCSLGSRVPSVSGAVAQIPFDSTRKLAAARSREGIWIKGAPERLLPSVRYAYAADGRAQAFAPFASDFSRRIARLTSAGGRVLLIAEAERMPPSEDCRIGDFGALTLIAAVLLCDRPRAEARRSVKELQGAGVQLVMITGDAKETAESIARSCGILSRADQISLSGEELAARSDAEIKAILPRLAVVARALPTDKSRLVRLAQECERVVGMTGDGVNDAPALKRADVGFAMGTGTGVARDAGDIIILDNNLSSIARAVLYGRNVFKSIRKFITLQLTMNFCAVGVSMIAPFLGIDAPVTVVQMLWINLIMDTLGGLAFAGEPPLPSCMKEKPKRRDEPILNGYMIHQILLLGGFSVVLLLSFLFLPEFGSHFRQSEGRICHLTAFFALFIFTSVFNCFNARTDRLRLFSGIGKNRAFLFIMALVCAVQIGFVYLGGEVLRTVPLTASELGYTLAVSLLVFPAEFLRKILWRLFGKKEGF